MISNRSKWLALAAVSALLTSSCMFTQRARHNRTLAVKAEAEADQAFAQAQALRAQPVEPEYFEGEQLPQPPAARAEQRPTPPSTSHVWIGGHYTRHESNWVWVTGHYALPPRSDVVWVPGHWVSHLHGHVWIAGGWR